LAVERLARTAPLHTARSRAPPTTAPAAAFSPAALQRRLGNGGAQALLERVGNRAEPPAPLAAPKPSQPSPALAEAPKPPSPTEKPAAAPAPAGARESCSKRCSAT